MTSETTTPAIKQNICISKQSDAFIVFTVMLFYHKQSSDCEQTRMNQCYFSTPIKQGDIAYTPRQTLCSRDYAQTGLKLAPKN